MLKTSSSIASAMLGLIVALAGTPASAQPAQLQALWKRSERGFDTGDYKAAEAAARQSIDFATSRFGASHRTVSRGLIELARVYARTDRPVEAEKLARRALAIRQQAIGPRSAQAAGALATLGLALQIQARYDEAEVVARQAADILTKVKPINPWQKGNSLRLLAVIHGLQGRYREADSTFQAAIAELERVTGREGVWTMRAVRQYANLLTRMGRHVEAEATFKRAIAGLEQRSGQEHSELIQVLSAFAHFLTEAGRLDEAEAIYERALAAHEKTPIVGEMMKAHLQHGMGLLHFYRGRSAESEGNLRSAISIVERHVGADHPRVAASYYSLAQMLGGAGRYQEAEAASRKSLTIFEAKLGTDSASASRASMQLGWILAKSGRGDEGKAAFERGVAGSEALFGPNHPRLANARASRAEALISIHQDREAFQELRRSSDILARITERDEIAGLSAANAEYRPKTRRAAHERLIAISWRNPDIATAHSGGTMTAIDHAFVAAQHAAETSTSAAISQMASRFAAGDTPLGAVLRQAQDLALKARALDAELVQQFGRTLDADVPEAARDKARLQKDLEATRTELTRIDTRIRAEFPTYDELTRTRALSIGQVQELLAEDEAVVTMFVGTTATYLWAVSRSTAQWRRLEKPDLERRVETLRCGLEVAAWTEPERRERCKALGLELQYQGVLPFDLGVAHSLYKDFLEPFESVIAGKRLITVPGGPLTSLPFQVLVATPPASALPTGEAYAKADWLVRRHAISMIPTVSSLRALRTASRTPAATRPLIGYGAPLFSGASPALPPVPGETRSISAAATGARKSQAAATKSARIAKGAKSNAANVQNRVRTLASGLQPLPETATELQRVAALVGAQGTTLMLGAAASEANVKRTPMLDYRVVYFATHGLVADEVGGLSEPALALTPPSAPTPGDDGLLTASEVAQLRLNADWVVLSACNTAAGSKPGAEALSGLARAFFHAGARAMLVSHWRVYSDAALALSTGTFEQLATHSTIGRDEALRRSILKLIDGSTAETVQPAYWAPFVVVGDGRGR